MTAQHETTSTLKTRDGFELPMSHYPSLGDPQGSVLLLHGASASSRTFLSPASTKGRGLVDFLRAHHFDVWTLDWRGGADVGLSASRNADAFTMDYVAEFDIPNAAELIKTQTPDLPLSLVGHCVGAATLSMSIGAGYLRALEIHRAILLTIGLFYEVTWDGWVKADDEAIERALICAPGTPFIHWNAKDYPWPSNMEEAYRAWPKTLLPQFDENHPFQRLTFMFGRPFLEDCLPAELLEHDHLAKQFGAMPMSLYIHAGQNVRRGFAAPYDDATWPPARHMRRAQGRLDPSEAGRYLHLEPFEELDRITLITGELNVLWHRDSIHRMHEWLRRGRVACEKYVVPGHAHQDLLWGRNAYDNVYPLIAAALS